MELINQQINDRSFELRAVDINQFDREVRNRQSKSFGGENEKSQIEGKIL